MPGKRHSPIRPMFPIVQDVAHQVQVLIFFVRWWRGSEAVILGCSLLASRNRIDCFASHDCGKSKEAVGVGEGVGVGVKSINKDASKRVD